ncbi:MAG: hypothetical protein JRI32_03825 [Deltaproteobacteria bacterium]|nr:hypothetical protein [Deltaproteobacteria bacterium]
MRLLIFIGLVYLCYRALKSRLFPAASMGNKGFRYNVRNIDDVMVKDPYCGVYFPKRDGIPLNVDGKNLYFCSNECRDKFIASQKKK